MALHPHGCWQPVVGEWVQIKRFGRVIDEGRVEAVTSDDQMLWLAALGVNSRRLIIREQGMDLWLDYKWDS
ncbi:hypothetical protein [Arthrobacter sp. M2012083]|uniref:hypothetical protein n=1 Tax=Arthrobacter sp. M2012083 TaxID=1197706 RepID=UPI0002F513BE|nr:hypothetical protein [Arthrobacter sp. M2012083]